MKRQAFVLVPVLALGLLACQKQAAPERTAEGTPPPAAAPAESPAASAPAEAAPSARPAAGARAARPALTSRPVPTPPAETERVPVTTADRASEPEPAPEPKPTPRPRVLPAGTHLPIVLETTLSTKANQPEDGVVASLAEDVVVDGDVVLPAQAEVRGHVVVSQRSGRVKGRARMVVAFDEIRVRGRSYAIEATRFDVTAGSSKGRDAKIAGGAAAAGAIIGAIADGGEGAVKGGLLGGAAGGAAVLATRGQEVELKAGSRYRIELKKSLRLD
jgi:hypothetical protein